MGFLDWGMFTLVEAMFLSSSDRSIKTPLYGLPLLTENKCVLGSKLMPETAFPEDMLWFLRTDVRSKCSNFMPCISRILFYTK